jgi:non-ribosomal peptide synthetase-like protein
LEPHTRIGDDAQLGTTSVLLKDQSVPGGTVYQGAPAVETMTDFVRVAPLETSALRAQIYAAGQFLNALLIAFPVPIVVVYSLLELGLGGLGAAPGKAVASVGILEIFWFSLAAYFAAIGIGLAVVMTVPRMFNLFFVPDTPHPLFGIQFFLARSIAGFSNSMMLHALFGDSSMIVYYFRALGYDLSESTQTGSNFGVEQRHHSPFLCKFNRNTLVSDGLVMLNMDVSSTSFRMSKISMPADTYLGNNVHYPTGSLVGSNCLVATKAMVPIDGPVRENVGLLGSPPFEIPRSVMRDGRFDHYKRPGVLEKRLRMKLRSNLVTLALFMFRNWSALFLLATMTWGASMVLLGSQPPSILTVTGLVGALSLVSFVALPFYFILFERVCTLLKPMRPLYCSLYDRAFWDHERFWKLNLNTPITAFDGTPMKNAMVRCQGAKLGSKVFDNGASISEPGMVEIGDHCCLNYRASIQGHSLEDGTFKSDAIRIGARCTIGVQGFVHYGASVGDDAIVEADAFVMKGSVIASGEVWSGNPAKENSSHEIAPALVRSGLAQVPFQPTPSLQPSLSQTEGGTGKDTRVQR